MARPRHACGRMHRCAAAGVALLAALALTAAPRSALGADAPAATVHTIFSTECNRYFDWQSLGVMHSARKVGQPGPVTRLMACNDATYETNVDVDTHTHPNWAVHPITGDRYSPYNKPASIVHWLEHAKPTAEYVIILDADMIIRTPMTAELVGVERGRPVSAHYGYLKGIYPENYMKVKERVKNVEKAQQVGGFSVMHIEDLRQVAPLWLKWTEEVRADPESWGNTGDIFNANGKAGPPWIAEMYGYVFACAEVGLDFKVSDKFMLYPGYTPPAPEPWPAVMHYGITYNVFDYAFDKHWYMSTDLTSCPSKLFQRPPKLEDLPVQPGSLEHRRLGVALSVAWGLYEATRAHAIEVCGMRDPPDPPAVRYKCAPNKDNVVICAQRAPDDVDPPPPPGGSSVRLRGGGSGCADGEAACCGWARSGECDRNAAFMVQTCARSCALCDEGAGSCLPATQPPPAALQRGGRAPPAPLALSDAPPQLPPGSIATSAKEEEHVDPALAAQVPQRKLKPHVAGVAARERDAAAAQATAQQPGGGGDDVAEEEGAKEQPLPDHDDVAQPDEEQGAFEEDDGEDDDDVSDDVADDGEEDEEPVEPLEDSDEFDDVADEEDEFDEEEDFDDVAQEAEDDDVASDRYRRVAISSDGGGSSSSSSDGGGGDAHAAALRRLSRLTLGAWGVGGAALGVSLLQRRRSAARGHAGARARLQPAVAPSSRLSERKGV